MKWLWRLLWFWAGHYVKGGIVKRAKRFGILAYLRTLNATRRAMVLGVLAFFFLQFAVLAGAGALVTGIWLLALDPQTKLIILFASFATIFVLVLLALAIGLSGRLWYKVSGADKMVENLTETES